MMTKHIYKTHIIEKKTWDEFRSTGLLLFVNQFLHIFGWSIVVRYDEEGNFTYAYPCRISCRGFSSESQDKAYLKITKYMKEHSEELMHDVEDFGD